MLYKQILSALWNTTTRGSTHKPKSTTHFTATIKHPSLSTSSINISAQQFKMPHQKGHVIRSHRVKSDTCWKHMHTQCSHDFCHIAASSIKSSVWLCVFSQANIQPTKLYHPSGQEAAVYAPWKKLLITAAIPSNINVPDLPPGISYKSCMQAASMHN